MDLNRRTFLVGTASGLTVLALSACVGPPPPVNPTTSTPTPKPTSAGIPRPTASLRSSWSKDEFSHGSDSFLAVGSSPDDRVALRQSVGSRVFFAGEATSSDRPATVDGAQASGARAAGEVIDAAADGERIAVIGAGIAGATAARRLSDAGFDVLVFEGRDRIGGRIDTVTGDDWPSPVELGAGWVRDTTASSLDTQLVSLGIATAPFDFTDATSRSIEGKEVKPSDVGERAVASAVAWAVLQPTDVSITDALSGSGSGKVGTGPDESGVSDADRLAGYLTNDVGDRFAAEPSALSAWYSYSKDAPPTDAPDAVGPTAGTVTDSIVLGSFSDLVKDALADIDVSLSMPVREIAYDDESARLKMATGESIRVDRVVVAVPLGVLKSDAIAFDPVLPFGQRAAIAALGMGAQEKVWLRFDERFWDGDALQWDLVPDTAADSQAATPTPSPPGGSTDGSSDGKSPDGKSPDDKSPDDKDAAPDPGATPFSLWFNLEPIVGEPVLCGVVSGDSAAALADLSDDEVVELALASLAPFVSADATAL